MFTTLSIEDTLARAKDLGLNAIRCSLTGQVVAVMQDSALVKAIEYEANSVAIPVMENVLDTLQTRWLIQSSRPAPHLTNHSTEHAFRFLRSYHPMDLFAILAGKMVFENFVATREIDSIDLKSQKMQWLVELQDSLAAGQEIDMDVVDALVRLDAIHGIRDTIFGDKLKGMAKEIRENEYNIDSLCKFISAVEALNMDRLSRMNQPPQGRNRLALSAALAAMTPEQVVQYEDDEQMKAEERRRVVNSFNSKKAASSGKATVRHGFDALVELKKIMGTLPPALEAKWEADIEDRKARGLKIPNVDGKSAPVSSSTGKKVSKTRATAMAQFGDVEW